MSQPEGILNNEEIEAFRQAVPPPTTPKNNSSRQMIQGSFQSNLPLLSAWGHYLRKQAIGKKKCLSKLNQKQTPGYEEEKQSGTPQPPPAAPQVAAYNYTLYCIHFQEDHLSEQEVGQKS